MCPFEATPFPIELHTAATQAEQLSFCQVIYDHLWAICRKLRNKLAHALNGNTKSLITKIHLEGAPILAVGCTDINAFLLWTIDLKAYCILTGITPYLIGPVPVVRPTMFGP